MKTNGKKFFSLLIGLMMLLSLLVACGGNGESTSLTTTPHDGSNSESQEAGETRVVKVGGINTLTGPTAEIGKPFSNGISAFFEHLKNTGGIAEGIEIDYLVTDYSYDISRAQQAYQTFRDRDEVAAIIGWGTADTEALRQQVAQDQLPFFSATYSENLRDIEESPYNFLAAATYSDQGRTILRWIKDNHEGDNPTVGLIYADAAFGRSPIEDIKNYAKEIGIEIIDEQVVNVEATEAQSQLLNMQKKNPDYVILSETVQPASVILRDAQTFGVETQFFALNWGVGELLIELAGDAAEGAMGVLTHALSYEDMPGMGEVKEYLSSIGKTIDDVDQKFIQGWATAKILAEGIKKAAEMTDGEIKGEDILIGLETLTNFDLGGLGAPVSFSADDHVGTDQIRLAQVKDGKWVPITDYFGYQD